MYGGGPPWLVLNLLETGNYNPNLTDLRVIGVVFPSQAIDRQAKWDRKSLNFRANFTADGKLEEQQRKNHSYSFPREHANHKCPHEDTFWVMTSLLSWGGCLIRVSIMPRGASLSDNSRWDFSQAVSLPSSFAPAAYRPARYCGRVQ